MSDGNAEVMHALLDHLGWALPRRDDAWQSVRCGNHDDRNASARVHMEEGAYVCLACDLKAGSPAGLVVAVTGGSWSDAYRLLESLGWVGQDKPVKGPRRPWKGRSRREGKVSGWREARA